MRRKIGFILMLLLLTGVVVSGYVWFSWQSKKAGQDVVVPTGVINDSDSMTRRVSVLLVGADQRPGDQSFNTDSLILASIDPDSKRISLLSIPRDTRVSLPGYGYVKINSVAALKDLQTLQGTVSDLTGVPVAGYIQTNFSGFKKIIDTLGGITVNVEKDMYYNTGDTEDGIIDLHKGVQRLDGTKALQYARFRHDALADISRTARQQVVLKAVAKEMLQVSTIPKLPVLIPQLLEAVHTNLGLGDIMKLAQVAAGFESANVVSQTLPGGFLDLEGVSYWDVDPVETKEVIFKLFQGITTDKVIDHEQIDLLKPTSPVPDKPLPKVPGNSMDPNGQSSTGYKDVQKGWPSGPDGAA